MAICGPSAIVLLGAPNDANGRLLPRARERCEQAWIEFQRHPDHRVLTTGGWGAHFNTTAQAHGVYTRDWLIARGVPESAFLPVAESANTPEDAWKSAVILRAHGIAAIRLVTSDFHAARARFCFERECPEIPLILCPSRTLAPEEELTRLRDHETRALSRLKGGGAP